jgi:hypothetical protein
LHALSVHLEGCTVPRRSFSPWGEGQDEGVFCRELPPVGGLAGWLGDEMVAALAVSLLWELFEKCDPKQKLWSYSLA